MLKPTKSGTTVKGAYYLDAGASSLVGLMSVKFEISGGTPQQEVVVPAKLFPFGWLGGWNTTDLPNGVYAIRSVAEDFDGRTTRSTPVVVRVDN